MTLLGIYILGALLSLAIVIAANYKEYRMGIDITMKNVYVSVITVAASWVGLIVLLIAVLSYFSDKVIIRGKEAEK